MRQSPTETVRLLVASREPSALMPLWSVAESSSWYIETAGSGWEALERIQSGTVPDLLLLDLARGDADSLHVVRWFHRIRPELPIILLSHEEERSREREAMRLGAQDFLVRPFDEQRLEYVIRRHLTAPVDASLGLTSESVEQLGEDVFFVGASPVMQKLRAQAELLAQADVPVLIVGEPGSGRDTVAQLIHKLSVRSGFRFLKVNCDALPGDLLEKELFGHSASPIATNEPENHGKLALSERGTVFLDDVAETPLHLQEKLLHVIEEKQVPAAGGGHYVDVDVRILAAGDITIDRAPANGKLREDLYYRLSAFTVHVPSLRQRRDEIPLLLRHFMHKLARHYGLAEREFSTSVLDACQRHPWPGNVRELESFVKRYLMVGDGTVYQSGLISTPSNASQSSRLASGQTGKPKSSTSDDFSGGKSLKSLINDVKAEAERTAIAAALERTGWNRKAAARLLKVSYRTLLYKIEQYRMNASNSLPLPFINGSGSSFGLKGNVYPLKGNGKTE